MSVEELTAQFTVALKRDAPVRGAGGGKGPRNYTTAARGSLPTSLTARGATVKATENVKFGVRGDTLVWKWLFSQEPSLTTKDAIEFADRAGTTRVMRCLHRSEDVAMEGVVWRVHCEEISNED